MAKIGNKEIPQELIDEIIDILAATAMTDPNVSLKATLSAVALVCHAFVRRSQDHLFRMVRVVNDYCCEDTQDDAEPCGKSIFQRKKVDFYRSQSDRITPFVRCLSLDTSGGFPNADSPVQPYVTEMFDVVKKCPGSRLTVLNVGHALHQANIYVWGTALTRLITDNLEQKKIKRVELLGFFDVPVNLFDGFNNLEILRLENIFLKDDVEGQLHPMTPSARPRPTHLIITNSSFQRRSVNRMLPSYRLLSERETFDLSALRSLNINTYDDPQLMPKRLDQSLQAARYSLTEFWTTFRECYTTQTLALIFTEASDSSYDNVVPTLQPSSSSTLRKVLDLRGFPRLSCFRMHMGPYIVPSDISSTIITDVIRRFLEMVQLPLNIEDLVVHLVLAHSSSQPVSQRDGTLERVISMGWQRLDSFIAQEFIESKQIIFRRVVVIVQHDKFQYQAQLETPADPLPSTPAGTSALVLRADGVPAVPSEEDEAMRHTYYSNFHSRMEAYFPRLRKHLGERFFLINHGLH